MRPRIRERSGAQDRKGLPGYCPRLERSRSLQEHARCPYCFGDRRGIQIGDRRGFCDFEPGRDPVSFGFPETHGRHLEA